MKSASSVTARDELVTPGELGEHEAPGGTLGSGGVREALIAAAREELNEQGAGKVSLRAVARRAGVSHAAPKHHFQDRAGLLTVVAADGHRRLAEFLRVAEHEAHDDRGNDAAGADTAAAEVVAALGRAYLGFGLDDPALFELMFRSDQLHGDDPELVAARGESLGVLLGAVEAAHPDQAGGGAATELALIAWAFVHGLAVLIGDGALDRLAGAHEPGSGDVVATNRDALARTLTATFTRRLLEAQPEDL